MRKTFVVVFVLSMIGNLRAQDAKKESPFEGWSIIQGKWEVKKDGSIQAESESVFQLNDLPKRSLS